MFSPDEIKKRVGAYAADYVENGMTIGLGTGSTVYWLLQKLAERMQKGLKFTAVPTSRHTLTLATELGISLTDLNNVDKLSLTIDGADETDKRHNLIKGGGGALLQEKIVAAASEQLIVITDESKKSDTIGKFPLPVEVIPFGWKQHQKNIMALGCKTVTLREKNNAPFVSDHGHYILDCHFERIDHPEKLNIALHNIPGVVETGLFIDMASIIVTGYADGNIEVIPAK